MRRKDTNKRKAEEVAAKLAAAKETRKDTPLATARQQKRPKRRVVESSPDASGWLAVRSPSFASRLLRADVFSQALNPKNQSSSSSSTSSSSTSSKKTVGVFGSVQVDAPIDVKQTTKESKESAEQDSLRDVPLKFQSSQEYGEVFLPHIVEEALEEARTNIANGKVNQCQVPWQVQIFPVDKQASSTSSSTSKHRKRNQSSGKDSFTKMRKSAQKLASMEENLKKVEMELLEQAQTEASPGDPVQQTTTLRGEFILHRFYAKTKEEVSAMEALYKKDRNMQVMTAEKKGLEKMQWSKRRCIKPSELGTGDLLLLSRSKDVFVNKKKASVDPSLKRSIDTLHWLGLVENGLQFIFRRVPPTVDPTSLSYEIVAQIDITFFTSTQPPRHMYCWKIAGLITSWREYDAVSQALSTNGTTQQLLNVLLKGKDLESPVPIRLPSGEVLSPDIAQHPECIQALGGDDDSSATASSKLEETEDSSSSVQTRQQESNETPTQTSKPCWIPGMTPRLEEWLKGEFNESQQRAILQTAVSTKGFTLIQGPPGTGKTHTLMGLLNMLHVSVFQRFYDSIIPCPDPTTKPDPSLSKSGAAKKQAVSRSDMMPHLLVTAPSNTAVDGMVNKLLKTRFRDGAGNLYTPNIVRVGKLRGNVSKSHGPTSKLDQVSIEYQLEELINKLKGKGANELAQRIKWLDEREKTIVRDMNNMKVNIKLAAQQVIDYDKAQAAEDEMMRAKGSNCTQEEIDSARANQELRSQQRQRSYGAFHQNTSFYMQAREKLEQTRVELTRCRIVTESRTRAQLRAKMRESILEHAHIVFVTLSSSALQQIVDLGSRFRFEVAVVDEAAQATEPSILVPLQHGVEHCVLVGDPRQLPATVLSEKVQSHFYQQSLFERLQNAGHSSYLLDTQYRCHPLISAFASKQFYNGQLKDGEVVKAPEYVLPIHSRNHYAFFPLTFYNVTQGRESKFNMSYRNEHEANLALNIYLTLREKFAQVPGMERVGIGIITPYREQLEVIKSRFQARDLLSDPLLDLNTVDGYQGREFDVIIMSCVRAMPDEGRLVVGPGGTRRFGIGFLNDSRRLNVAITRAKYMLIVLGQDKALSISALWRAFLKHVKSHGHFVDVPDPNADLLAIQDPYL